MRAATSRHGPSLMDEPRRPRGRPFSDPNPRRVRPTGTSATQRFWLQDQRTPVASNAGQRRVTPSNATNCVLGRGDGSAFLPDGEARIRPITSGGCYLYLVDRYFVLDSTESSAISKFPTSAAPACGRHPTTDRLNETTLGDEPAIRDGRPPSRRLCRVDICRTTRSPITVQLRDFKTWWPRRTEPAGIGDTCFT